MWKSEKNLEESVIYYVRSGSQTQVFRPDFSHQLSPLFHLVRLLEAGPHSAAQTGLELVQNLWLQRCAASLLHQALPGRMGISHWSLRTFQVLSFSMVYMFYIRGSQPVDSGRFEVLNDTFDLLRPSCISDIYVIIYNARKISLWHSNINFLLGVTTWGTPLKNCSSRHVENCCSRSYWWQPIISSFCKPIV